MATVGLYGSSSSGVVAAASGSESIGLYGNGTSFGGSYFEWFIFQVADTQPATPTGGSWDFNTNTGTPPTGWSSTPPANPTNIVWVSIALVNSKNVDNLVWSAPGKFSYSSGLPILSGSGTPGSGDGQSDQLYIQLDTTPQTIWFKESGTWTRLTGSTLYVDTTSNQTIAGTKTFSSQIQGSISGTASNVTGIVGIANGGTGSTTATGARTALGAAASGANSDITSLSGLTTALSIAQGGTGATTANGALSNLGGIGTITSTDGSITVTPAGTTVNLAVSEASPASTVLTPVRNTTGATLTKGTVVYISGATGQIATVSKALASSDATSAQTLGMITSDLPNNTNGYVTVFGLILDIDTSAYADGAQLYLSGTTAGAVTATKPSAPTHLVYVAVVEYSHAVHGKLLVKVQNGYELDELHNVSITSPATGQTIIYDSGTSLWSNSTVSLTAGVNGTLPIANGGTGQTTANAAFNALAPSQTGNSGKYLTTDGTNTSWATNPLGTVTSVGGTGTVSGITLSGTVTTSGNLTLGGALDLSAYNGAGAFTTLSASGAVTLSGGTANGVAYLNGSKVVTTGSALTFDGTNLGVGTATPVSNTRLHVHEGTTTISRIRLTNSTTTDASGRGLLIAQNGVDTYFTNNENGVQIYSVNGSEAMRLTSTGLGIGTSSPAYKLDVSATGTTVSSAFRSDQSQMWMMLKDSGTTLGAVRLGSESGSLIAYANGNQLTYNSSGNLGLGVTPSAWGSGIKAIEIGGAGTTISNSNGTLSIGNNSYINSGYKYARNATASLYEQSFGGGHYWYIAPSGTAGNAISFTQAMTLNAAGQLGIGTTSPSYAFDVNIATTGAKLFRFGNNSIAKYLYGYVDSGGVGITNSDPYTSGAMYYLNGSAHNWYAGSSQAMTLDASGNLGVGQTSPGVSGIDILKSGGTSTYVRTSDGTYSMLSGVAPALGGGLVGTTSNHALLFYTNNTERARIDSSGNLLVGTTGTAYGSGERLSVVTSGGGSGTTGAGIRGTNAVLLGLWNSTVGSSTLISFAAGSSGAGVGSIATNGSTTTTYNTSSDYRLKENIQPMTGALAKVAALKPCTYKWKVDGSDGEGFIAHELAEVCPQAVTGEKDAVDADGNPQYQGIDTSFLVATLTAAIQELKAEFDAYKATHP